MTHLRRQKGSLSHPISKAACGFRVPALLDSGESEEITERGTLTEIAYIYRTVSRPLLSCAKRKQTLIRRRTDRTALINTRKVRKVRDWARAVDWSRFWSQAGYLPRLCSVGDYTKPSTLCHVSGWKLPKSRVDLWSRWRRLSPERNRLGFETAHFSPIRPMFNGPHLPLNHFLR